MSGKRRKKTAKKSTKKKSYQRDIELSPELKGWLGFTLSLIMLCSLLSFAYGSGTENWLGLTGYIIGWSVTALLGLTSYILVFYLGWFYWRRAFDKSINTPFLKHFTITLLITSVALLLCVLETAFPQAADTVSHAFYTQLWNRRLHFHLGGAPFYYLYMDLPTFNLHHLIGNIGITILSTSTLIVGLLLLTKTTTEQIIQSLRLFVEKIKDNLPKKRPAILTEEANPLSRFVKLRIPNGSEDRSSSQNNDDLLAINPDKKLFTRPSLSRKEIITDLEDPQPFEGLQGKTKREDRQEPQIKVVSTPKSSSSPQAKPLSKREAALSAQKVHNGDFTDYKLPEPRLLTEPKHVDQSSLKKDLRRQAEVLEETLLSFGIEAKVGQINCGPTITSFEVHPAIGVKVQKIKALESDIALNMEAKSIRILAPIPGKAAVGIEVPNPEPQEVAFKDMLSSYYRKGKKYHIPVLLGKTVNGDYVTEDLAKMPHVIIAGATGSGKSVCINTVVMSILMTAKPDEIKLIMVDPKKVELTPYTRLPHMLAPVITEPTGACAALGWLVKEMENRYEILKLVGYRNISSFNTRKIDQEFEESLGKEIPEKMPYIVCIIDELADLMMVASNDIETYIARIAQMARAVGIHLILATQRPSREVITGLIKANFPTRISFKVSSRINSQIILDEVGAETLLGNGDMLFLPPGAHHLVRAQGAYIRDEDINGVVERICSQAPPNYMIESFDRMPDLVGDLFSLSADKRVEEKDALYDQALDVILSTGNASTTFLQRKLKVGYARAASIIDQLEAEGVVGPADGSKPRQILVEKPT